MTVVVEPHVSKRDEQFIHGLSEPQSGQLSASVATTALVTQVGLGTPADSILKYRGRARIVRQRGSDAQGLLVEWAYPDAVYVIGRRESQGITAYRVISAEHSGHK